MLYLAYEVGNDKKNVANLPAYVCRLANHVLRSGG